KPHVTIAFVKKGKGQEYVGDIHFEGREFVIDSVTFSAKNGKSYEIPLTGKPPVAEPEKAPKADVKTAIARDIEAAKAKLIKQANRKGISENFGEKEVRDLEDKHGLVTLMYGTPEERKMGETINDFRDWTENYIGEPKKPDKSKVLVVDDWRKNIIKARDYAIRLGIQERVGEHWTDLEVLAKTIEDYLKEKLPAKTGEAKIAQQSDKTDSLIKKAKEYVNRVRNLNKRQYADKYFEYVLSGRQGEEPKHALSPMAAQAVRLSLDKLLDGVVKAPAQKEGIAQQWDEADKAGRYEILKGTVLADQSEYLSQLAWKDLSDRNHEDITREATKPLVEPKPKKASEMTAAEMMAEWDKQVAAQAETPIKPVTTEPLLSKGDKVEFARPGQDTYPLKGTITKLVNPGVYKIQGDNGLQYDIFTQSGHTITKIEPVIKPTTKELWQMTRGEQLENVGRPIREHKEAIIAAHKAGEIIPGPVLSSFPELDIEVKPTAKDKAEEAKQHLKNAADKFKQINAILDKKGAIGPELDQGTWEQILPLLKEAFTEILAAGKSGAEFVSLSIQNLSQKGRPYFEKFVNEEMKAKEAEAEAVTPDVLLYHKAKDLAKEGFTSWDSRQGYDTYQEAAKYLDHWERKHPDVEFRLSRQAGGANLPGKGTLSIWGKPKTMEKAGANKPWALTQDQYMEGDARTQRREAALRDVELAAEPIRNGLDTIGFWKQGETLEVALNRKASQKSVFFTDKVRRGNKDTGTGLQELSTKEWTEPFKDKASAEEFRKAALVYIRGLNATWLEKGENFDSPNILTPMKHEALVLKAYQAGKPVPANVLADYPNMVQELAWIEPLIGGQAAPAVKTESNVDKSLRAGGALNKHFYLDDMVDYLADRQNSGEPFIKFVNKRQVVVTNQAAGNAIKKMDGMRTYTPEVFEDFYNKLPEWIRLTGEAWLRRKGIDPNAPVATQTTGTGPRSWAKEFPKVIAHTNAQKITSHPDHQAAKEGSINAAIRLVGDLFDVSRAKALGERHPGAILVAVHSQEEAGKNKIPIAFAEAISAETGLEVDTEIVQTNVTGHTAKKGLQRLLARAIFDGKVEPGRDYIILDDVITQGGTISELKQYIEANGGIVVEVTALACAQFSSIVAINPETVQKLISKYGRTELENILKENRIPPLIEALTQSEARLIAQYKGSDSLRSAIAAERQEAGIGSGKGILQDQVKEPVKPGKEALGVTQPSELKGSPSDQVAEWIFNKLYQAETITWRELFAEADKAYGGTQAQGIYSVKDAYDAMEIGINRMISKNAHLIDPSNPSIVSARSAIQVLKKYLERIPTQTKRTEEMDEYQQFSTPPPLAFVAAWVANLEPSESVLEPSGGTGNIAIMAKNAGAKVTVNELSQRRFNLLGLLGFEQYFKEDAGQINNILPETVKPTTVLMNPPFTAAAGRLKRGSRSVVVGQRHVAEAAARLEPGGRLVAIMGQNMAPDKGAYTIWARRMAGKGFSIRANISISGEEYKKYGTNWDNQLIILDKTPTTYAIIEGKVNTVEELLPLVEGLRNDRADKGKRASDKPESEGAVSPGEAGAGQQRPVLPATGVLVDTGGVTQAGERGPDRLPGEPALPGTPRQGDLFSPGGWGEPSGTRNEAGKEPERRGVGGTGPSPYPHDTVGGGISQTDPSAVTEELDIRIKEKEEKGELTDEIYEGYRPEKMIMKGAKPHPTPLVQSAAMSAINPPNPTYKPKLSIKAITSGKLSDIQLEAVVYAGQAHEQFLTDGSRMGFFIGDGCVDGETRIYDPETDKHETIHELAKIGKPITVLSLTENGFAAMKAYAPFLK
ncbi:MAG: strawberry notch family protein, partial [Methanosarcinaceae archaeon]|nr:strawberry notch family protein [Methanosarcinaceae archaeon]